MDVIGDAVDRALTDLIVDLKAQARNDENLLAWRLRRLYQAHGLEKYPDAWDSHYRSIFTRYYLEQRLAARHWLAMHCTTLLDAQATLSNVTPFRRPHGHKR